jgi:hypothetical protein
MDANQVKTFCDIAAQLLMQVSAYAATEVAQRKPADEALIRQLRVAASALNDALNMLARVSPPVMPMPPPPTAPTSSPKP